ncbi:tRNA lysidine(34) synthetase TilS [Falsiruegeria mediterranea]
MFKKIFIAWQIPSFERDRILLMNIRSLRLFCEVMDRSTLA